MRRVALGAWLGPVLASIALAGGPVYHGPITVRVSKGPLDAFGTATVTARRWTYILGISDNNVPTNGVDLSTESLRLEFAGDYFVVPVGSVTGSADGKKFTYRGKTEFGVQRFKMIERGTNTYEVSFRLAGANLSDLKQTDETCRPFAIIIGDDAGFRCLRFQRPPRSSKRFSLVGTCDEGVGCDRHQH